MHISMCVRKCPACSTLSLFGNSVVIVFECTQSVCSFTSSDIPCFFDACFAGWWSGLR